MRHATNCKFCKRPITITIDDDYAALGDPFKIIPMASCNACAELRVARRRIERQVQFVARCLELAGPGRTEKMLDTVQRKFTSLTEEYAKLITRWHNRSGMLWDEEIVRNLIEKPDQWGTILSFMWKAFQQYEAQEPCNA